MNEKKRWYNFFITLGEGRGEGLEQQEEKAKTPQTVEDVAGELPALEFRAPLRKESGEGVDFQTIYETAGIQPPEHGFTILKICDMLQSEHLRKMTSEVKKNAILVALEAAHARIEEVIQDAVKRDRALDTYEKVEEKALRELEQQKASENAAIQKEIDEFLQRKHAQMKTNNEVVEQAKERFSGWQLKKQREEQRIYETVAHFISENPITTSTGLAPATPSQTPDPKLTKSSTHPLTDSQTQKPN